jgi:cytochrome c
MTEMLHRMIALALGIAAAGPVLASGDIANGAKEFGKCKACHAIVAPDGREIVKGGKSGPNLFGILGQIAGTRPGARYSASLVAAGAKGLVWDAASLEAYVTDPTRFLQEYLGDAKARGTMTFKLRTGGNDIAAYLASLTN